MQVGYVIALSAAMVAAASAAAAGDTQVPLFVIERSLNSNVVHYDARLKDGKLDPQQPVVAYWVMGEDGRHQELNFLEKLKAYGFSIFPDKQAEVFRMTLVSDKEGNPRHSQRLRSAGRDADRPLLGSLAEDLHRVQEILDGQPAGIRRDDRQRSTYRSRMPGAGYAGRPLGLFQVA